MSDFKRLKLLLEEREISIPAEKWARLEAYKSLLLLWGNRFALVSRRDLKEGLEKHFADSLLISPYVEGRHILDLGSGAGFPGIPLAIVLDEKRFTLIESRRKKWVFLREVRRELGLENLEVVNARWEDLRYEADLALARATGSTEELLDELPHLLKEGGYLLLYSADKRLELLPDRIEIIENPYRTAPFYLLFFRRD